VRIYCVRDYTWAPCNGSSWWVVVGVLGGGGGGKRKLASEINENVPLDEKKIYRNTRKGWGGEEEGPCVRSDTYTHAHERVYIICKSYYVKRREKGFFGVTYILYRCINNRLRCTIIWAGCGNDATFLIYHVFVVWPALDSLSSRLRTYIYIILYIVYTYRYTQCKRTVPTSVHTYISTCLYTRYIIYMYKVRNIIYQTLFSAMYVPGRGTITMASSRLLVETTRITLLCS